jgi:signal transduction histidine kinase/ligand-binding sensor domain-containing protein
LVPTLAATPRAVSSRRSTSLALLAIVLLSPASRVFALDPTSHISQYGHSVWRVRDGYFGGAPQAITQTTDGYIWVGTDAGLFKFDGVTFLRWNAKSGEQLPSSEIDGLLGARDGSLWIATGAGLAHLLNNRLILYEKNAGWIVANIFEDRDGKIWFRRNRPGDSRHSLCQVLDDGIRCYGSEDGVDVFATGPIAQDASGDLWVGSGTGFVRWRPGASTVYRPKVLESNEGNYGVRGLVPAPDGTLWVGIALTGRGAGLRQLVAGVLKPFLAPDLNGEALAVEALFGDRQNSLWVGTERGLYKIRGAEADHFDSADGLSSDLVRSIFEDREGNIWAATSRGIDMFRDLRVKSISHREGLIEGEVESVAASQDGKLWVGTDRLQILGPGGASLFGPGEKLPGSLVTYLFADDAGRLWTGMNNRLFVDERGSFREVTKEDGGALGMVMGIAEDFEHNMWVESAGPPGTLFLIQDLKVRQQFPAPAMPLARKIVADAAGGIWLGLTTGDLARYHNGQLTTFTFGHHPNARVRAIIAAPDGSILGATAFGIVGWKNGQEQTLTVQNGLPCNTVHTLISDNAGNLWLYAECGLIEIPKQQMQLWWQHPESQLTLRMFDVFDGAEPGWASFNASAKTLDGRLWFTNDSVVQVLDPAHIPENTVPPPVDIRALIADRKVYMLDSAISLPPRTRELEIDYTALSFSAPQKVRFRYRLEGHDSGWQEPGTRRQAFYNDLAPGKYRFRVRACNNDGVWNETGAFLDFSILPAYYQTAWFRALCVAALLLLLWFIYQMRVRQVARAISVRFDERLQERTRIAQDFHDTYLQTIQGSKLVADSALKQSPDPARMRGALEQLSVWLGRATEEGRAALKSLRSSATEKNDLAAAFERAIEECRISSPMEASFLVAGEVNEMHPIVRDEIYRIGYEAIRNSCVHSHATHLQVELTYADDLTLRVRDNGVGIAPAMLDEGKQEHFGLQGMRERARRITAAFEIDTSQGSGTEITLIVPGGIIYCRTKSGVAKWPAIESLLKKVGLTSRSADS